MSFWRHREIYPDEAEGQIHQGAQGAPFKELPVSKLTGVSFQPGIPWRGALQQSPPPLPGLDAILLYKLSLDELKAADGNCPLRALSQPRGSPQFESPLPLPLL